jgi:hypothetical protein
MLWTRSCHGSRAKYIDYDMPTLYDEIFERNESVSA